MVTIQTPAQECVIVAMAPAQFVMAHIITNAPHAIQDITCNHQAQHVFQIVPILTMLIAQPEHALIVFLPA